MSKNRAFLDKHADKISKFLAVIIIFGVFVSCFESAYRVETMYAFSTKTKWEQRTQELNYFDNKKIIVKDAPLQHFEVMGTQTKNKIYLDKDIKSYDDFLYYYTHEYFHFLQEQYPRKQPKMLYSTIIDLKNGDERVVTNFNNEILTDLITYQLLKNDSLTYLKISEAKNLLNNDEIKQYVNYFVELSQFNSNYFEKLITIKQ